jgi:uncharacterized protein (TIGR02145 family)
MANITLNINPCILPVKYGLLYNFPAVSGTGDNSLSSSDDWVVPTQTQYTTLREYLGGQDVAGGKLKETGLIYWGSPNTGATNESGFNGRGTGYRDAGVFGGIKLTDYLLSSTETSALNSVTAILQYNSDNFTIATARPKKNGSPVRLLYIGAGIPTSYVGNNGHKYRVVIIGTQIWLADNLIETEFRNGNIIPFHGVDNTSNFTDGEWVVLTTAGVCAYDNDVNNVAPDFSFPTV